MSSPDFGWDGSDVEAADARNDALELEDTDANPRIEPNETGSSAVNIEDYEVAEEVAQHLGVEDWRVFEVLLSSHATLLLDGDDSSHGVLVEGVSSSGKTTLLELFQGLDDQSKFVHKFTPASLLSGHTDIEKEEAEQESLLNKTTGKTLVAPELGTLLEGDEASVREKWALLAGAMDGGEFTRYTGTHNELSVKDIHFNLLGATTPLDARQHRAMGNVGGRVLIVKKTERSTEQAKEAVFEDELEYGEKKERCRTATHGFLTDLWRHHGGRSSVDMPKKPADEEVVDVIGYLTDMVRYCRAPPDGGGPAGEGPDRAMGMLMDLARGHALLFGREWYGVQDLDVCVRAALGSVPREFDPALRLVLRRAGEGEPVTRAEVEGALNVSKATAIKRMDRLATFGLVEMTEVPAQGGPTKAIELPDEMEWPEEVYVP